MKALSLFLVLVLSVFCFIGCGESADNSGETTVPTDTTASDTTLFHVEIDPKEKSLYDADFPHDEYISLGEYRDLPVTVSKMITVDDDFINRILLSESVAYGYIDKDDSISLIENGHAVSVDFESTINGEEYSGGSQSDFCILIGSESFLPEFEQALIGKAVGDSFEVSVPYPDDYPIDTLAGKMADFLVTVNYAGTPAEVTDDLIKEITFDEFDSVSAWKEYYTEYYEEYYALLYKTEINEAIWNNISTSVKIHKLPVSDRMDYCNDMIEYFTDTAEEGGYTYADFLEAQGYTENEFLMMLYNDLSEEAVTQKLILSAVCKNEGISPSVSDDEYNEYLKNNYLALGFSSAEEFENSVGRITLEDSVLFEKVISTVAESIEINEK